MISGPAGKVISTINRPNKALLAQFEQIPTSIIADCYSRYCVLDTRLRPVNNKCCRFIGTAVTVEDLEGGNFMSLFAIELMEPGDVVVIDVKNITSRAGLGSINAEVIKRRGGKAIIVYGAVRDKEELEEIGIPVFSVGFSPAGPHKGVRGNVNCTIAIGSTTISPGDIIVGDADGVVRILQEDAEQVLADCKKRLEEEKRWMEIVNKGGSMVDVLKLNGRLKEFNVEEH